MKEEDRKRILKGFNRNLDHKPALPWRSIGDTFGVSIVRDDSGGQLIGTSSIVNLPIQLRNSLEAEPIENELSIRFVVGKPFGLLGLLLLEATTDHEWIHYGQIFSNHGLSEYERIEKRNLAVRLARRGELDRARECTLSKIARDYIWVLETLPLMNEFQYLSCPEVFDNWEKLKEVMFSVGDTDAGITEAMGRHVRYSLGQLLIQSIRGNRSHSAAWSFSLQCVNALLRTLGPTCDLGIDVVRSIAVIIANKLAVFKSFGPLEILKTINNLGPEFISLIRRGELRTRADEFLKIDHLAYCDSALGKLKSLNAFFDQIGLKGPIERTNALIENAERCRAAYKTGRMPNPSGMMLVLAYKPHYFMYIPPRARAHASKTMFGGFVDTYIADQVVSGRQLRCPFARSPQNIWGCADCSGLIEGKDLNHKCEHAKRWLD